MSRKNPKEPQQPASPKSPVTLRLGDMEDEVEARAGGQPVGGIVRRDLARYYRALRDTSLEFWEVDDADLVVHALRNFDAISYQYAWAEVDDWLSRRDATSHRLPFKERFDRVNREHLKVQMRVSGDFKQLALVDAVERYWMKLQQRGANPYACGPDGRLLWMNDPEYPVTDAELETMVDVGFIRPDQAEAYRKKRDDPNRPPAPEPPSEAELYVRDLQESAARRLRRFPGVAKRAQEELEAAKRKPSPKPRSK